MNVRFSLIVDPNAEGTPVPLKNQAYVMANSILGFHLDRSDTGPDPESSNPGEEGDSGGEHDSTCVNIPIINLNKNLDRVEDILQEGAKAARNKGEEVLERVRTACGLKSRGKV